MRRVAYVRVFRPYEGDRVLQAARRQVAQAHAEAVGVGPRGQPREALPVGQRAHHRGASGAPEAVDVEGPRRHAEAAAEAAREVGARAEPAGERDLGQRAALAVRHEGEGRFEADARGEGVQRLADERAEDAVEVVGRELRDSRYLFEPERRGRVLHDVVDGAVDAIDVVETRKIWQVGHPAVTIQSAA